MMYPYMTLADETESIKNNKRVEKRKVQFGLRFQK